MRPPTSGEVRRSRRRVPRDPAARPDHFLAHKQLGVTLRIEGKLDEAADELRTASNLRPGDSEARVELGDVLVAQGKMAEAIAENRTAIRLHPENFKSA